MNKEFSTISGYEQQYILFAQQYFCFLQVCLKLFLMCCTQRAKEQIWTVILQAVVVAIKARF